MKRIGIGIVGCGKISDIYLTNLTSMFDNVRVVAVADLVPERARAKASEYKVERACSVDELLSDPAVDIVLNITIPAVHAEVALAAVRAGKHVYNEKPLTVSREDGARLLQEAAKAGVLVGCAPDTFLGAGLQTSRWVVEQGLIGEPIAATAFMAGHGPEGWHPDPEFFYKRGGGPMFDMGPYYLTALISLIGPVRTVTGMARASFAERTITSQPKSGTKIKVDIPTHVAGTLEFQTGAIGTIVTSFDVWAHNLPRIEIHGTTGSLSVPDPNTFGGPVQLKRAGADKWEDIPLTHGHSENSRGIGLSDMARAIGEKGVHRANGEMAFHVLDIMHAIHEAAEGKRHVTLGSSCTKPQPLPPLKK
ncbi:MAG TPA: Gfo/Idh/MocA family oxidoreductase [Spirochaetia bacterium]|nr:Gfo/Idh/MocA family oxidoreductase [Spirochaetia bacterium]